MSESAQPFLGLCVITRDAASTIDALLESVMNHPVRGGSFSEFVFVDTGSTDDTRERIASALRIDASLWPAEGESPYVDPVGGPIGGALFRIVLARFPWIDDFAAARNYSFGLARAKWRMWLDADDVVPDAYRLKEKLQKTEREHPEVNVVQMRYDYAPPVMSQDKWRIVRWADGWRWEGAIHEELVPYPQHQRRISVYRDVVVEHRKTAGDVQKSVARNTAICTRLYESAKAAGDVVGAGKMAYYLGQYAEIRGDRKASTLYRSEAGDALGITNLAAYAWVELAHHYINDGLFHDAIRFAGNAIGRCSSLPDGYAALGIALSGAGEHLRAIETFEHLWRMPEAQIQSNRDKLWLDAKAPMAAATSYLAMGRSDAAGRALERVPLALARHETLNLEYGRLSADYYKQTGLVRLNELANFLIWNNEPVKALELLDTCAPSIVESLPAVSAMKAAIWDKMQQLKSWSDYKRVYAAETNEVFDRGEAGIQVIREQGRAQLTRKWAESLPKDGPPIELYVIGIHGGWIEEDVLDANPRIRMTACDVNPNANSAIQRLSKKFPGRVSSHTVVEHHYDWIPPGRRGTYDVVFCFEVIEHVPEDHAMVQKFTQLLKPGGRLFLSTPVAEYWVEPNATTRHHWHQHVRAYQPEQLVALLHDWGFSGDVYATDNRSVFFCDMRHEAPAWQLADSKDDSPRVTIWCPHTPKPFDPISQTEGHLGGSEEAVVHLAPWLARLGARVEVYTDSPDRLYKPHLVQDVLWRPKAEFDPARLEGTVLVWRSPQSAAWLKQKNPKLRVLQWMHDVGANATPEQYRAADGTIVLSKFHAEAIKAHDGFEGPFLYAANGIEPSEFAFMGTPEQPERDPHLAIYASAPNRGLDMLLGAWPLIRERVPDARLEIYYGWETTEQMMDRNPQLRAELAPLLQELRERVADLKDLGVTYVGGVDHATLNRAYARAGVWTYPVHNFDEIFCISALRAQAAGCVPVTMDRGAIKEVVGRGTIVPGDRAHFSEFVDVVVRQMTNPWGEDARTLMAKATLEKWSWEAAARKFLEHVKGKTLRCTIVADGMAPFDHQSLHTPRGKNVGGCEEAVICLAEALASKGVDVEVIHQPPGEHQVVTHAGVTWNGTEGLSPRGPVIVCRKPHHASALKSQLSVPVITWCMDPGYGAAPEAYGGVDAVVVSTSAHREIIKRNDGYDGPVTTIHNGLLLNELPPLSLQNDKGRHPEWVMWATSPDRGLVHLLRMWPSIKAQVPAAQLHIFYGVEGCYERALQDPEYAELYGINEIRARIENQTWCKPFDVHYHGSTPRTEFIAQHVRCGTFAYTNDQFDETFGMAIVRAQACGMWPVFTANGSLPEVVEDGSPVAPGDWRGFEAALVTAMKRPPSFALRKHAADIIRERYSVEKMANEFIRLLERLS